MDEAIDDVRRGEKISVSLDSTGQFTPLSVDMVTIGEETGKVSELLDSVSGIYISDVDDTVDRLILLLEPMVIMLVAILIIWVAIAVFGPIYGSLGDLTI